MQNFLSLWLNAGAQITHGGEVQRPRQKVTKMESKSMVKTQADREKAKVCKFSW